MADPLWKTSLRTIGRRIEAEGVKHGGMPLYMVHGGAGHADKLKSPPNTPDPKKRLLEGSQIYGEPKGPPQNWSQRSYWCGEPMEAAISFYNLAQQLSDSIAYFRHQMPGCIAQGSLLSSGSARWIWIMFDVLWSQRRNGFPDTTKSIWFPEHTGRTKFRYDPTQMRLSRAFFGAKVFESAARSLPDYYCSEVPDAFLAANLVIEYLLNHSTLKSPSPKPQIAPTIKNHGSLYCVVDDFRVIHHRRSCKFPKREKLLFALTARLVEAKGRSISFKTLCEPSNVWEGNQVDSSTIRGAVSRLRKRLKASGLTSLSSAISTMSYQRDEYVSLDLSKLTLKSH